MCCLHSATWLLHPAQEKLPRNQMLFLGLCFISPSWLWAALHVAARASHPQSSVLGVAGLQSAFCWGKSLAGCRVRARVCFPILGSGAEAAVARGRCPVGAGRLWSSDGKSCHQRDQDSSTKRVPAAGDGPPAPPLCSRQGGQRAWQPLFPGTRSL